MRGAQDTRADQAQDRSTLTLQRQGSIEGIKDGPWSPFLPQPLQTQAWCPLSPGLLAT